MAGAALLRHLGPRLFAAEPVLSGLAARGVLPAAARIFPARMASTAAAKEDAGAKHHGSSGGGGGAEKQEEPAGGQSKKAIVSYWGIDTPKLVKADGTEWTWACFRVSAAHYSFCNHTLFRDDVAALAITVSNNV
jgi:ubiquinol oxidase